MSGGYTKEEIFALLEQRGISYEQQEHDAVYTMEDVDRAGVKRDGIVLKNLFLKDGKGRKHFLVSVPENRKIDLKALGEQIGAKKLGLASEERLKHYLGVEHGCVSPFGLLNNVDVSVTAVFDSGLSGTATVGVHPNDTRASVWLEFQHLVEIVEEHGNEVIWLAFEDKEETGQ